VIKISRPYTSAIVKIHVVENVKIGGWLNDIIECQTCFFTVVQPEFCLSVICLAAHHKQQQEPQNGIEHQVFHKK